MQNLNKIKLIVLDVDGTLTDGGIYYDSQGNEIKRFDVKDGLGIKVAIHAGIEFAIITGRKSQMVEKRAKELGIKYLKDGVQNKAPVLDELLKELQIAPEEMAYIGDDWNDLESMQMAGFKACPQDAAEEIKEICDYVSIKKGGYGAVRDCIECILKEQRKWTYSVKDLYCKGR